VGNDSYWWGGNLKSVTSFPIKLNASNKIIYSPHDYGPGVYDQPWFNVPEFPNNLPAIWTSHWAYIHTNKSPIAPIWIGEFGGHQTGDNSKEGKWQNALVDFIKNHSIHFSYWCLNPNSGNTGGILLDDWKTLDTNKTNMLKRILQ
jgi:endoglucanase